jgi:hypothetical protein
MRFWVSDTGDGHLRAVPLDGDAADLCPWPTAPKPLCGRKKPSWRCERCRENAAFLQTTCIAVERVQARLRRAESENRRERTAS